MFTNFIFILFSNINNNIPLNISLRKNRCHIKKQKNWILRIYLKPYKKASIKIYLLASSKKNWILRIYLKQIETYYIFKLSEGRQYFVKKYKNIYTITLPFSDTNFCTHKRIFFFKNIKRCRSLSFG
ncbi:hypothetical protein PFNF135_04029 [Plasmodium falciparum NF135/5.C10]|uniref:Uncharacterized protein n=1 Tax=Plasmodium falciparum NF135/5.C10 TaxID=1036726 RepID=W4IF23_PLAFA|nr:hypothetical protein PFNF135_04029 [Plasmodium falciparum NF135/5.C10]